MSEVQRFWSHEASNIRCVREADFDRVTAERDALQDRLNESDELCSSLERSMKNHRHELGLVQQRLTAADEREDVLWLDAARYRWLRDPDNQEDLEPDSDYLMPPIICGYSEHEDILSMEALDKAIDSAMSEASKP